MTTGIDFGFYPEPLDFTVGDITVATLDGLEQKVEQVTKSGLVERGWRYAPPAASKDFMSGLVRTLPYNGRVFGLPQSHSIRHTTATDPEHLRFLVWMLGFIQGIRLSDTEAGFLDATPIRPGTLHDIVWLGKSDQRALAIADAFWRQHATNPRIAKGVMGIVHSLFLSQTPTLLDFEEFTYLYVALDGCHFVWSTINGPSKAYVTHKQRIASLCAAFKCPVPAWADAQAGTVATKRNETLHEGLFFDEPLGYAIYGGAPRASGAGSNQNTLLEMQCLVCRLLCGIVGFDDASYLSSPVDTRQRHGVRLT